MVFDPHRQILAFLLPKIFEIANDNFFFENWFKADKEFIAYVHGGLGAEAKSKPNIHRLAAHRCTPSNCLGRPTPSSKVT